MNRYSSNQTAAQIDYIIVTQAYNYVVECKNLYGDIEINSKGDFIRNVYGKKEGIYSPVTQNARHLEMVKYMLMQNCNPLSRARLENSFYENFKSVVVLSNPKTILNDRYAPKEIKEQVIRADGLIEYIKVTNGVRSIVSDKKARALAELLANSHVERNVDFTSKYVSSYVDKPQPQTSCSQSVNQQTGVELPVEAQEQIKTATAIKSKHSLACPKCNSKLLFEPWGCSEFPECTKMKNDSSVSAIKSKHSIACPKCNSKLLFEPWGCSEFPSCANITN